MTAFITKVQKNVLIAYSAPEQTSAETFLQININLLSNWGMIVCTHHRTVRQSVRCRHGSIIK